MPTSGAVRPIQRVPSGLPGPGGIGFASFAHSESGGRHHGFFCMSAMLNVPDGVGYSAVPVATPNRRTTVEPLKSTSWLVPRLIVITGPNPAFVIEGRIERMTTGRRPRIRLRRLRVIAAVIVALRTVRPQRSSLI